MNYNDISNNQNSNLDQQSDTNKDVHQLDDNNNVNNSNNTINQRITQFMATSPKMDENNLKQNSNQDLQYIGSQQNNSQQSNYLTPQTDQKEPNYPQSGTNNSYNSTTNNITEPTKLKDNVIYLDKHENEPVEMHLNTISNSITGGGSESFPIETSPENSGEMTGNHTDSSEISVGMPAKQHNIEGDINLNEITMELKESTPTEETYKTPETIKSNPTPQYPVQEQKTGENNTEVSTNEETQVEHVIDMRTGHERLHNVSPTADKNTLLADEKEDHFIEEVEQHHDSK